MDQNKQIHEIIDRETNAWDTKDISKLISIFHPDMVWVWPKSPLDHDPLNWEIHQGKFNESRWREIYNDLFNSFDLIHNNRVTLKVEISKEKDGAFAVVDIDTLWKNKNTGKDMRWWGRTCKIYSQINSGEWKMINQIGVLDYSILN